MTETQTNGDGRAVPGLTSTDRLLQAVTALSLLMTPVVVAVIGYRATSSSTSKDYVSLAVSILNAKDSPKESRQWATTVLNKLSPVPVSSELKTQLGSGTELGGTAIPVNIPVPVGCITTKTYNEMRSIRPPPYDKGVKPRSLTDDQLIHRLAEYAARMDDWADGADAIMKNCSDLTVKTDEFLSKVSPPAAKKPTV